MRQDKAQLYSPPTADGAAHQPGGSYEDVIPTAHQAQLVSATSQSKVILCGEHGVVYGAKGLGLPLADLTMTVAITPATTADGTLAHQVRLNATDLSAELASTVTQASELVGVSGQQLVVDISSQIPLGAGLGASAALSINLIKALHQLTGRALPAATLVAMAGELEKRFHGKPSGIDVGILVANRLISFCQGSSPLPLKPPRHFHLALVDSGVRSSTKMMGYVAAQVMSQAARRRQLVQKFNDVHELMLAGMSTKSYPQMSLAMAAAAELARQLGVMGEVLEDVSEGVMSCGGLACKPTGSGGAGFVLALLPEAAAHRHQVVQLLEEKFSVLRQFVL